MRSSTRARTTSTRSTSADPGSTNNQNGRFEFTERQRGAAPASASRTRRWACSRTTPRSASARLTKWRALVDRRLRAGFVEADQQPDVEGGVRWASLAAVVLADEQHRDVRPGVLQHEQPGRRSIRRPAGSPSGPRYNGIVLPGDGFPSSTASNLAGLQRSGGARAVPGRAARASPRRTTTRSSRAWASPTR